jgi:Holliday junction resolvase RusA-like endonuclease
MTLQTPTPMRLSVTVPGEAVPQGSTRAFIPKGWTRPIITGANNAKTKPWRASVAAATLDAQLSQGTWPALSDRPIRLDVACYFVRPASVSARRRPMHTVKPDLDKLLRALKDSLTRILWRDDAQVVSVCMTKGYAPDSEPAHTVIHVHEIVPDPVLTTRPIRATRAALPLLDEGGTRG